MWHERLRKQEELNTMTVMLQKEVDKYKVLKKKRLDVTRCFTEK